MTASAVQMLRPTCRTLGTLLAALALLAGSAPGAAANEDEIYIVQTNAAGDNVHLIDPATKKIVAEITGVEVIHEVAAAADGSKLYLSNESTHALDMAVRPPRGLYRFRVTDVTETSVVIGEVEEDVLLFF